MMSASIDEVDQLKMEIDNLHFEVAELKETVDLLRNMFLAYQPQVQPNYEIPSNMADAMSYTMALPQMKKPAVDVKPRVNRQMIKKHIEDLGLDPTVLMRPEYLDDE